MNNKTAKKIRQLYRRDYKEELVIFKKMLRPKPRWMPKILHKWGLKLYFNIK